MAKMKSPNLRTVLYSKPAKKTAKKFDLDACIDAWKQWLPGESGRDETAMGEWFQALDKRATHFFFYALSQPEPWPGTDTTHMNPRPPELDDVLADLRGQSFSGLDVETAASRWRSMVEAPMVIEPAHVIAMLPAQLGISGTLDVALRVLSDVGWGGAGEKYPGEPLAMLLDQLLFRSFQGGAPSATEEQKRREIAGAWCTKRAPKEGIAKKLQPHFARVLCLGPDQPQLIRLLDALAAAGGKIPALIKPYKKALVEGVDDPSKRGEYTSSLKL